MKMKKKTMKHKKGKDEEETRIGRRKRRRDLRKRIPRSKIMKR